MSGIAERLRDRAESYRQSGPSAEHTAALLKEGALEIESLLGALVEARRMMWEYGFSENDLSTIREAISKALNGQDGARL